MATTATTLSADYQPLIADIRKLLGAIKGVAVDLERENKFIQVKELEETALALLNATHDCVRFSSAVKSVGEAYVPGTQSVDFAKLLKDECNRLKEESPPNPLTDSFYRQFREAVWNVHHSGESMPGEEIEDIVMTGTQSILLNITCPLTGKPVTELEDPVRSMDCKHIYEKAPIIQYIKQKAPKAYCPMAGCPRILRAERVVDDPLLLVEIDEMRSRSKKLGRPSLAKDFTELEDD